MVKKGLQKFILKSLHAGRWLFLVLNLRFCEKLLSKMKQNGGISKIFFRPLFTIILRLKIVVLDTEIILRVKTMYESVKYLRRVKTVFTLLIVRFIPDVLFVYFLYKKSAFCLKMTATFFVFCQFDQKRSNQKWNEPNI